MNNPGSGLESSFGGSSNINFSTVEGTAQDRWAVILAGGDGSRLLPLTRKIAGDERPKQFCRIIGGSSLLDETRRRVALALSPRKTMFVLTQKHECFYDDALAGVPRRNLIIQPRNTGTAPAILYSLMRLATENPNASVAFFPSDHYFSDDRAFMNEVEFAFDVASRQPDLVILLGIEPESPDEDYGWIEPDSPVSTSKTPNFWRVRRFWEKPSPALARELMRRGCLWNSFVMVGTVSAFLKMIRCAAPEFYTRFAAVKSKLGTPEEEGSIRTLYAELPDSNFSQEVLTLSAKNLAVMPFSGSKWSDLGSPHRVFSTLSDLGAASLMKREPARHLMKLPERFYEQSKTTGSQIV